MHRLYRLNLSVKKWLLLSSSLLLLSISLPSYAGFIVGTSTVNCGGSGSYAFISTDPNLSCSSISWTVSRPDGSTGSYFGPNIVATMGNVPGTASISASGWCFSNTGGAPQFESASYIVSVGGGNLPLPSVISGTNHRCNSAAATYSISAVSGAGNYTWQVPSGWSINGGGTQLITTSTSVSVTAPSSGTGTGTLQVRANRTGPCGGSSPFRTKTIHYGTQTPNITGPSSVGIYTDVFYSSSGLGLSNWSWTVPNGWSTAGTTTSNILNASSGSDNSSGWLQVNARSCGFTRSDAIYVTVSTDSDCDIFAAHDSPLLVPCLQQRQQRAGATPVDKLTVGIFPNPVAQVATVQVQPGQRIERVQVYNQLQQLVLDSSPGHQQAMLDFTRFDNGLYFIKVNSAEQEFIRRIVVKH